MLRLIFVVLLLSFSGFTNTTSPSARQDARLAEVLGSDPFYRFQKLSLKSLRYRPRTFDFSEVSGWPEEIAGLNTEASGLKERVSARIRLKMPYELMLWCAQEEYRFELHLGTTRETLYWLTRMGVEEAWLLHALGPLQTEFVLVEPTEGKPGRLIFTNLYGDSELLSHALMLKSWRPAGKALKAEQFGIVDFHVVGRQEHLASFFKETFTGLPKDIDTVVLDSGNSVFERLVQRKFAGMTLKFLKGIYGKNFLQEMKYAMIEEGCQVPSDYDPSHYTLLQSTDSGVLNSTELSQFLKFQTEAVKILQTCKDTQLGKLLLFGNELSVSKEPVIKQDVIRALRIASVHPDFPELSFEILPVKTATRKKRILVATGISSEAVEVLPDVLGRVGVRNFWLLTRGQALRPSQKGVGLVMQALRGKEAPLSVKQGLITSSVMQSLPHFQSGFSFSSLLDLPGVLNRKESDVDFLDASSWFFAKSLKTQSGIQGAILAALETSNEDLKQPEPEASLVSEALAGSLLLSSEKALGHQEELIDFLIPYLKLEDILLFADPRSFGFQDVGEKVQDYLAKSGLNESEYSWFLASLEEYLSEGLKTEEEKKAWLSSPAMEVPSLKGRSFSRFLSNPYRNEDILQHLKRVEHALMELIVYLRLRGEEPQELVFRLHGSFARGILSPLTPIELSVTGVSQETLLSLMKSPFGNLDPGRPLLLQVVPAPRSAKRGIYLAFDGQKGFGLEASWKEAWNQRREQGLKTLEQRAEDWILGAELFQKLSMENFFNSKSRIFRYTSAPVAHPNREDSFVQNGVSQLKDEADLILGMLSEQQKDLRKRVQESLNQLRTFQEVWLSW